MVSECMPSSAVSAQLRIELSEAVNSRTPDLVPCLLYLLRFFLSACSARTVLCSDVETGGTLEYWLVWLLLGRWRMYVLMRCRPGSLYLECYLRNGLLAGCFGFWCLPCLYGNNASKMRSTSCSGPGCCYACCPCFTCSANELLFRLLHYSVIAFVSCRARAQAAYVSLGTHKRACSLFVCSVCWHIARRSAYQIQPAT